MTNLAKRSDKSTASDIWSFERQLRHENVLHVAGVDEAGRGPLAGPVVSAAVILPHDCSIQGLDDSKKLPPTRRAQLFEEIYAHAVSVGIGIVDREAIDRINILQASLLSMRMAVSKLDPPADHLLIDGKFTLPEVTTAQEAIIKGDTRSASIAAASIVAKVSRDRLMHDYHLDFPLYGFDRHKGYPTRAHKAAIAQHGPCPIHRRSFRGVKEHLPATVGVAPC